MTMVALIMRSWILEMRNFTGIAFYILADDVLSISTGIKMASTFAKTLNATRKYLHMIGAKVAPCKSYNFASSNKIRRWLKTTLWEHIDSGIEVISDFRYLGAHLTTRQATSSSTLDKRWDKAKQQLKRLRHCPASTESETKIILAKIYAGAMYGIEAAIASPKKIGNLTAAVIDVFKNKSHSHNANQFFSTISKRKNDLDPAAQILARRVLQIRRTTCNKNRNGCKVQKAAQVTCRKTQA